jgi:hypothetical protein
VLVAAGAVAFVVRGSRVGELTAANTGEWFVDWATYSRAVGRLFGGEAIYPAEQLQGSYHLIEMSGYGYAYPPASVVLMVPFAPDGIGLVLWEALLVTVFFGAIWAIVGLGFPRRRLEAFGIALLATAFFYPAMQGFVAGNVNMATAGLLGWAWVGLPRAGLVSGVVGVLKVFPAAIAVLYGRRAVLVTLVTMTVIVLITLPFVGITSWRDYAIALRDSEPFCRNNVTNLSFECLAAPAVGLAAAKVLSIVFAALLVLVAARFGRTLIGLTAVAVAIMVPAADLHLHYWSFALVLLVIALARLARIRRGEPPDPSAKPLPRQPLSRAGDILGA